MEKTVVPEKSFDLSQVMDKTKLQTLVMISTNYTGRCKSN